MHIYITASPLSGIPLQTTGIILIQFVRQVYLKNVFRTSEADMTYRMGITLPKVLFQYQMRDRARKGGRKMGTKSCKDIRNSAGGKKVGKARATARRIRSSTLPHSFYAESIS